MSEQAPKTARKINRKGQLTDIADELEHAADVCSHIGLFSAASNIRSAMQEIEHHVEMLEGT